MTVSFEQYRKNCNKTLETQLQLTVLGNNDDQATNTEVLRQAMAYSLLGGGKRLRALLVISAYEAITGNSANDDVFKLACSVESMHAYSLIHDDLPAMDDDELRRGKPTNHIAFGEATAILAGDALQALAFEIITNTQLSPEKALACLKTLAQASGANGMVGGQQYDLNSENKALSLEQLQTLHEHKTGALIRASLTLGGIAAEASADQLAALDSYGSKIGLAFQVIDDVLDIESDTETLGKPQGADLALNKATYPSIMGLSAAKDYAQTLVNDAKQALSEQLNNPYRLYQIADFVHARRN